MSDDCISRHKAIVAITACDGKSAQIKALEKLPSVKQKTGKWIWGGKYISCCRCSKCGCGEWEMEFPYCANCGAKMEVSK